MSSETTSHLRSYLEIIVRLSYACGKQREWTRKNHLQSALFTVKRVNFYLLFFFWLTGKKNRKKFFYLLFVLKKTVSTSYFPSRIFGRLPNGKYCYAWAIKTPFNMDL